MDVWTAGAQALTIVSFDFFTALVGILTWRLTVPLLGLVFAALIAL